MVVNRTLKKTLVGLVVAGSVAAALTGCSSGSGSSGAKTLSIGVITKTNDNPYWAAITSAAQKEAKKSNVKFTSTAGAFDGDTDGEVTAIENLVAQGVNAIIVTPSSSTGLNAAIKSARASGVLVIALDTATDPQSAVDALYATDNQGGGVDLGKWAAKTAGSEKTVVAAVDGVAGSVVSDQRHNGFVEGMGLKNSDVVASQNTDGSQDKGQAAAENILQAHKDVNVIYAINEPAAIGASVAVKQAGRSSDMIIATFDGSCTGIKAVKDGQIDADIMQFPSTMGSEAVKAAIKWNKTGTKPKGYINSGSQLITDKPIAGIESKDTTWGLANCWG